MVIAADGNTYLGKTTFLRSLAEQSPEWYLLVEEYDTDLELLNSLLSHQDKQRYYFSLEEDRVRQYGHNHEKTLLLDRSFLSLMAHSWAMSKIEEFPHYHQTLMMLRERISEGKVLIPDRYCFFIQEDEEKGYSDFLEKGSEEILYNKMYRSLIDSFFRKMAPIQHEEPCPIPHVLRHLEEIEKEMEFTDD